ncbi:MAG: haloalkane dehalogenase [Deltaproteobacteria bacterium]|nr:haloalkane dehalogenase [Deltaproteobacteria bacterium]
MEILRTPDERFASLQDWPHPPRYVDVPDGEGGSLRMHYVDAAPAATGPTRPGLILCLHGQPTWSYLYRKLIPIWTAAGHRVVAPDLVGFGRSDKPTRTEVFSYARHVAWLTAFVEALDLRAIDLVCQDWGGLLGLRVVAEHPERFARVLTTNTGLPDGRGIPVEAAPALRALYAKLPVPPTMREVALGFIEGAKSGTPAFLYWQKHCADSPRFTPQDVMRAMCPRLSEAEIAAYAAPFPDERFLAAARRFPALVPILPDDVAIPDNQRAWEALGRFEKPFLTAFTDGDPVTQGMHLRFQTDVPGAAGQPHTTIRGAGHFVQEDAGPELARIALDFFDERAVTVR